jgi:hypothetical protein
MHLRNTSTFLFLAACSALAAYGQTTTWTADRTLRIEFRMPTSAWPLQPNTLMVAGGYVTIQQPHTKVTQKIYNGSTLLGTAEYRGSAGFVGAYSFHGFGANFKSANSTYPPSYRGTDAVIDFNPLLDRTIQGRVDVTIDAGKMLINPANVYMHLSEYIVPGRLSGQSIYPNPIITSVKLIPELPGDNPPPPPAYEPPAPVPGPSDNGLITGPMLKSYCDQAKGTAVIFRSHVTLLPSSIETSIATGCTIEILPGFIFTVEGAMVKFGGPLTIQSQGQASLKLLKSRITAPGIALTFPGAGSKITGSESTLRADGGGLNIALGDDASVELSKRHSSQTDALWSTGKVTLSAGRKLVAGFLGSNVRGNLGILLNLSGAEGNVKAVDGVTFNAPQGAVQFLGSGAKSMVEMSDTQIRFQDSLSISLTGNESSVKMIKASLGPVSGTALGGVQITAGANGASLGNIEGAEVSIRGVRSVQVTGAATGQGSVKWEKGSTNALGNILFQGGGSTELVDNNLTSTTLVRIFTPGNRSCNGTTNSFSAPVIQICPSY